MKLKNLTKGVFALSAILVASGLLILNYGVNNSLEFWINFGSETYGAGLWLFALFLFGKLTKMIK